MSKATRTRLPERIAALCCECGAIREVSFRYVGATGDRDLRCTICRRTTRHAPVRPEGWDYREANNRRGDGIVAKVQRDIDHMEGFGIWVTDGKAEGGRCDIRHYLDGDAPAWRVVVNEGLSAAERLEMIEWAWKAILPSWVKDYEATWHGDVCRDEYGEFRGCYHTGR